MSANQIAEIRPAIREVIEGAPETCATLEVAGAPGKWMQVVDRTINAAYPHEDHPQQRVSTLPWLGALKLTGWEAGKFASFELHDLDVTALARWIDAYFVGVLACPAGAYHLDVSLQKL